ncbi:MAG: L,D-transpeptidase family protein [Pararhodobacter sp.]|nr:L,D-transpeptidase family protein [Pararhodobacter sp.]
MRATRFTHTVFLVVAAFFLASCASGPRFLTYDGPDVTRIVVHKAERRMVLWHHDTALRAFDIQLGRNPIGHKRQRGDGRTPEGEYFIDRRNPNSSFHLSLGISYPDANDRLNADEAGVNPGGDIFIHGRGRDFRRARGDWTEGCIAVTDREMEVIYSMIRTGTPITILP